MDEKPRPYSIADYRALLEKALREAPVPRPPAERPATLRGAGWRRPFRGG
jgi:hypothetical protein